MTAEQPGSAEAVWVPTPPGWVEVGAFDTDARAEEHWRAMVEPVRAELGDAHTEDLYRMLRQGRAAVADVLVSSAGLVVTLVDGELAVWTFSTTVEHVPSGEISPAALVERGVAGHVESVEDVDLPGGRTGVLAVLSTPAVPGDGGQEEHPAQQHCLVAVALPDRPRDIVLVSGSSGDAKDPELLAMAAVSMAAGVVVGAQPPTGSAELTAVLETFDRLAPDAAAPGTSGATT